MTKRICLVVTDAISFNVLCRGQLEFFRDSGAALTLVCGGDVCEVDRLVGRSVGKVVHFPFRRRPSILFDIYCLFRLWLFFLFNRFDATVYSTPKALLVASLASFFSFHKNRVALVRGRVYESSSGFTKRSFLFLDWISLKLSSRVVFISNSLRNSYLSEGLVSKSKSFLVQGGSSNGVDADRFRPAYKQCDQSSARFSIVVVGRACEDKGVEDVFKVHEYLKKRGCRFSICWVGDVEDEMADYFFSRLLSSDSFKHVTHTDNVPDFFRAADLHLFLSHREGFGNVAVEAASCGIPTFAYDIVGIRDSVCSGVSGLLFSFRDWSAVAREISKVMEHRDVFQSEYRDSRQWALDNFEQNRLWRAYLKFFVHGEGEGIYS